MIRATKTLFPKMSRESAIFHLLKKLRDNIFSRYILTPSDVFQWAIPHNQRMQRLIIEPSHDARWQDRFY